MRGGIVCPRTPPSWPAVSHFIFFLQYSRKKKLWFDSTDNWRGSGKARRPAFCILMNDWLWQVHWDGHYCVSLASGAQADEQVALPKTSAPNSTEYLSLSTTCKNTSDRETRSKTPQRVNLWNPACGELNQIKNAVSSTNKLWENEREATSRLTEMWKTGYNRNVWTITGSWFKQANKQKSMTYMRVNTTKLLMILRNYC